MTGMNHYGLQTLQRFNVATRGSAALAMISRKLTKCTNKTEFNAYWVNKQQNNSFQKSEVSISGNADDGKSQCASLWLASCGVARGSGRRICTAAEESQSPRPEWGIHVKGSLGVASQCHYRYLLPCYCIGLPIHCNYQLAHYSGFCRISPSVLNRFKRNLQA